MTKDNIKQTDILVPVYPALTIQDQEENHPVMKIENNGKIFWRKDKDQDLIEVKTDQEIGLAFALCVEAISGMNVNSLLDQVRKQAVTDYLKQQK